jgi:catechol 2,3-dioxygenase-like lactoylglutathione lyase family enzyme
MSTNNSYIISGIQQIGVGIPNVQEAFAWYRRNFGTNIKVFDDAGTAALMLPYTGGLPRERHAILAMNIQGGGGFEIWQYVSRTPEAANFTIQLGDLGLYVTKIKCKDVKALFADFKSKSLELTSEVEHAPDGSLHFFVKDPYNNIFQIVEDSNWFTQNSCLTGGTCGSIIGVSDMEKSLIFYRDILEFSEVIYDKTSVFDDFKGFDGGNSKIRRVLLKNKAPRKGPFGKLLGPTQIELVQVLDRKPEKIFKNRLWGDLGFIHLCFDVVNMDNLKANCAQKGFPFTVDTNANFDMGDAAGRFAYTEDPDGTLFEFVETYKVPVIKKLGWYINLTKRDNSKNLPNWMLKSLKINKVKD